MKSYLFAIAAAGALFAAGSASAQSNTFDAPIVTSPTQAPGAWYTNRYAPAGFQSGVVFGGDERLKQSISAADSAANRPSNFSSSFYNTQGRKLDLDPGTNSLSIDLFIDSSWATGQRRAGLWGQTSDPNNTPVLEFTSDGSGARFQGWDTVNGGWLDLGLPGDSAFAFDQWSKLNILLDGGNYIYSVGDKSASVSTGGATSLEHVILQGYNAGASYDIYWDNLNAAAVPEPATWAMMISGFGLIGFSLRSRRRTLATA